MKGFRFFICRVRVRVHSLIFFIGCLVSFLSFLFSGGKNETWNKKTTQECEGSQRSRHWPLHAVGLGWNDGCRLCSYWLHGLFHAEHALQTVVRLQLQSGRQYHRSARLPSRFLIFQLSCFSRLVTSSWASPPPPTPPPPTRRKNRNGTSQPKKTHARLLIYCVNINVLFSFSTVFLFALCISRTVSLILCWHK